MDVSDFLTSYPPIEGDKKAFARELYGLREFYEERYVDSIEDASSFSNLLKHQKVISRFLSGGTPYRGLLVVHEVGTGKTCGAIAIAEANRQQYRRVFFISPNKHLNSQQKKELEICFPDIYGRGKGRQERKLYEWNTQAKLAKTLASGRGGDPLTPVQIFNRFSNSVIIIDEAHDIIPSSKSKSSTGDDAELPFLKSLKDELTKAARAARDTGKADAESERELATVNERLGEIEDELDSSIDRRREYRRLFTIPSNIKIVLLTGTPMTNSAKEFAPLLQLLVSRKELEEDFVRTNLKWCAWPKGDLDAWLLEGVQLGPGLTREQTDKARGTKGTDWDNVDADDEAIQSLTKAIRGRVSFLKSPHVGIQRSFVQGSSPYSVTTHPDSRCVAECAENSKWQLQDLIEPGGGDGRVAFQGIEDPLTRGWWYPSRGESDAVALDPRVMDRVNYIKLYTCAMSVVQTEVYSKYWVEGSFVKGERPDLDAVRQEAQMESWLNDASLASLIVVPVSSEDSSGIEYKVGSNLTQWMDSVRGRNLLRAWFLRPGPAAHITEGWSGPTGMSETQRLQVLYNYCPKYVESIRRIRCCYGTKKIFVFNRQVEGGASRAYADLLSTFGYQDITFVTVQTSSGRGRKSALKRLPDTKRKRFVLLTGKTPVSKTDVLALYNHPLNAKGEYIQVVIGSEALKQGFTIKDVQEMHVVAPPWNYSSLDQAMGRILRKESHGALLAMNVLENAGTELTTEQLRSLWLKPTKVAYQQLVGLTKGALPIRDSAEEVRVDVCLFAALPQYQRVEEKEEGKELPLINLEQWEEKQLQDLETSASPGVTKKEKRFRAALKNLNSVDIKKYYDLEKKDRAVKTIERLIKINAIDCPLFYARNYVPEREGQRECEYEANCSYICEGMSEDQMKEEVAGYASPDAGLSPDEINNVNFDVLYSQPSVAEVEKKILEKLREGRFYPLNEFTDLGDSILVLKALENLTTNNVIARDSKGFLSYIREEDNVCFLTKTTTTQAGDLLAAKRPTALIKDDSQDTIGLLGNALSARILRTPGKLPALLRVESPEVQEYMLETAFVQNRVGGITYEQQTLVNIILDALGGHLQEVELNGTHYTYSTLMAPDCFRRVDVTTLVRALDQSQIWCAHEVLWKTPPNWEDTSAPPISMHALRNLIIGAVTWPRFASAEVKAQLLSVPGGWYKGPESTMPARWVGGGTLETSDGKSKPWQGDQTRCIDLRWLYRETVKELFRPGIRLGYTTTVPREKVGMLLGLLPGSEVPSSYPHRVHGVNPLELCVPTDTRKVGEGRTLGNQDRSKQKAIRAWLDKAWEGAPHGSNGEPVSGANPYWLELDGGKYKVERPRPAVELRRLGLWIPEYPVGITRDQMRELAVELAGI